MSAIFEPEAKFLLWLEIELLAAEGWAQLGEVPPDAIPRLRRATVDPARIDALEARVGHDLLAFLGAVSEPLGDDARYLHRGLTSSDVLDTALAVQLTRAADVLLRDLAGLHEAVRRRATAERDTLMVGRTHGMHAEPLSLGFVLAGWLDELGRARARVERAREEIRVGKLSGAVGTHATVDPRVEEFVCARLGLQVAPVTTQVIARDRHAAFLAALAVVAGSLDKFATDIRHWQSSGVARTVRGYALVALEDQALWHERDISHSSAERIIFPDACMVLDYMLRLMTQVVDGLTVDRQRMHRNLLQGGGIVFSQRVLLALVEHGMDRDQAYRIVQRAAHRALDDGQQFREVIAQAPEVRERLTLEELSTLFDPAYYLRNLRVTYERVGL